MGAVYLVNHIHLNKRFALKVIATEGLIPESDRRNFETEAHALGRLSHPNIVSVTDYGVDPRGGGMPYLVMEYLEGQTVRQALESRRFFAFPEAAPLLRKIANAIDIAHSENIVHGDLKPSNLFLANEAGRGEVVKVVDFGLARLAPLSERGGPAESVFLSRKTGSGTVRGTPAYMAHELFRGEVASPGSDRFALGALAYEMLTGEPPFGSRVLEVRENQRKPPKAPSARNPQIPAELDAALLALLSPNPELRPSSCAAAIAAMEAAWLAAEQRKWREREVPRRFVFAAIAAAAAILAAGLATQLRIVQMIEERIADARFAMVPPQPPDAHFLVVALDEAALADDPRPLTEWDAVFGRTIEQIFGGGARAVAIDILLPGNWSGSREFSQVIERHADRLALAKFSQAGEVVGPEFVSPLTAHMIGPDRFIAMFGFVNLDEDPDGTVRRARIDYRDRDGHSQPSFAARAIHAALLEPDRLSGRERPFWIDYTMRPDGIAKISWKDIGARLKNAPDLFQDKLVIVGADYTASNDLHRVPASVHKDLVSGAEIQAVIAKTIAAGLPVRDVGWLPCMLVMAVICFAMTATTLRFPHHPVPALLLAGGSAVGYALLAFVLFRLSRIMIAVAGPELAIVLSAGTAWYLKSRLSPYPSAEQWKEA